MSRLQAIENSLSLINEAAFRELCDSFFALRNSNYAVFLPMGSQSGKQQTVNGTADTFLFLPSGNTLNAALKFKNTTCNSVCNNKISFTNTTDGDTNSSF